MTGLRLMPRLACENDTGADSQMTPVAIHRAWLAIPLRLLRLHPVLPGRRGRTGLADRDGSDPPC